MTKVHLIPGYRSALPEAMFFPIQGATRLFFIQLAAVWRPIPKVRAKPRRELLSCAARSTNSLVSSLGKRLFMTPLNPQSLHLKRGLPTALLPFFIRLTDWHFVQLFISAIIFSAKIKNIQTWTLPVLVVNFIIFSTLYSLLIYFVQLIWPAG